MAQVCIAVKVICCLIGGDGWARIYPPWIDSNDILGNNEFGDVHLKSQNGRFVCDLFDKSDFNYDGITNLKDFAYIANRWKFSTNNIWMQEDLNFDMVVDINDLLLFCSDYLKEKTYGQWVTDDVTSFCIDAGNPASDWTSELWPHGTRINMGAYGGTPEASMSSSTAGNKADFNLDGVVDGKDLDFLGKMWLVEGVLLFEDINRNGLVNGSDFAEFAGQWGQTYSYNFRPQIYITNPENGDRFQLEQIIEIAAEASDPDGSVVQVEFFANSDLIGVDNDGNDNWAISWEPDTCASYSLTATAEDDEGAKEISLAIIIDVDCPPQR